MTPEQIMQKWAERMVNTFEEIGGYELNTMRFRKLSSAAEAELQPLADLIRLIEAQDQLLACYRLGKHPSEKLFDSLRKGRAALEKLGSI
jgi:hypothetical protein